MMKRPLQFDYPIVLELFRGKTPIWAEPIQEWNEAKMKATKIARNHGANKIALSGFVFSKEGPVLARSETYRV